MKSYPFNTQVFEQKKPLTDAHHKAINLAILIFLAAAAVGFIYWWNARLVEQVPVVTAPTIDRAAQDRARLAELINNSTTVITDAERSAMAKKISQSKTVITQADRDAMAAQIKSASSQSEI